MLVELAVRDLGVLANLSVAFSPGMTALTGETGAGKTLLVEALELLVGGRGDASLVRPGAAESLLEARFEVDGEEMILTRALPVSGRSRAWVDTRMAPVSALAEAGRRLVDLHGQHAHQSLITSAAQRALLDVYAGVDHGPARQARARLQAIDKELASIGGDARVRAREIDLLRFQLDELERAGCTDPDEERDLAVEEERLAGAQSHREAGLRALDALAGEGSGYLETLGAAVSAVSGHGPLAQLEHRLRAVEGELSDTAADLRLAVEDLEDDPERLAEIQARRSLLRDLRRKYGDTLADVIAYREQAAQRLVSLESHEATVGRLESARAEASASLESAEEMIGRRRRASALRLESAIQQNLRKLAMPRARMAVQVGAGRAGDDVTFLLAANPGEPELPLAKVASGGELSRTMLAARLVSSVGPPTLVFDEVDAGIGGEAGLAVGRALAMVAAERQVLVVTHLPQVAAFADHKICLRKSQKGGRIVAEAEALGPEGRVVELSRMMSGQPASAVAREHAEELLRAAARERIASSRPGPSTTVEQRRAEEGWRSTYS